MNIVNLFENAAAEFPQKSAIVKGDDRITFVQLQREVDATANYFHSQGIGKGDRVLIFIPMSVDLYRVVLSLFKIGAVAVFLDEWVSKERMELCCRLAQCKGFIGIAKARLYSFFSSELRKIPVKLKLKGMMTSENMYSPVNCYPSDTALITFTTGSTGIPKAADRTHGFLNHQFKALKDTIRPLASDVDMPVLPIVALMNLGVGCTSVIASFKSSKPGEMKAAVVFEEIELNKVNRITASPFFVKKMAEFCLANKKETSFLKKIFTGGAPVFPSEACLLTRAFPNTLVEIVYGSTEAEPVSHIYAHDLATTQLKPALSVGKVCPDAEVKIIKISGEVILAENENDLKKMLVAPGQTGEIIVSGDHVLKKYFNNDEAFRMNKIVCNGRTWHRTGDSGCLDAEGNLFLSGRCSTVFEHSGFMVFPFVIEGMMKEIAGVEAGTVLKVAGDIVYFVECTDKLAQEDIQKELLKVLPLAGRIIFGDIPRDQRHFSKIDYALLRNQHNKTCVLA